MKAFRPKVGRTETLQGPLPCSSRSRSNEKLRQGLLAKPSYHIFLWAMEKLTMEQKRFVGENRYQSERMIVVLPQRLAAYHLQQCEHNLKTIREDRINFLYAAEAAHMAFHTMLVAARYGDIGLSIMRCEGTESYPGGPKEGGTVKSFKSLFRDLQVDEGYREDIMLLTCIRDRLQHPLPGPMGYIFGDLLSGIVAAVSVTMGLWDQPCLSANSDGPDRDEALAASHAILVHCSTMRSW